MLEVGHRQGARAPVHPTAGHLAGHLIDRRGGKEVLGTDGFDEGAKKEIAGQRVGIGVTEIETYGVAIEIGLEKGRETLPDPCEGLLPGDLAPPVALLDPRPAQAIGVVVERADRSSLGTEVAATVDVVAIAADADYSIARHFERQAAGRLTERAGSKCFSFARDVCLGHGFPPRSGRWSHSPAPSS